MAFYSLLSQATYLSISSSKFEQQLWPPMRKLSDCQIHGSAINVNQPSSSSNKIIRYKQLLDDHPTWRLIDDKRLFECQSWKGEEGFPLGGAPAKDESPVFVFKSNTLSWHEVPWHSVFMRSCKWNAHTCSPEREQLLKICFQDYVWNFQTNSQCQVYIVQWRRLR